MPRQKKSTTTTSAKAENAVKAAAEVTAVKTEKPVEVKPAKTDKVKSAPAKGAKTAEAKPAPAKAAKTAEAKSAPAKAAKTAKADSAKAPKSAKKSAAKEPEKTVDSAAAPKKRAGRKPKPVTVDDIVAKISKRIDKSAGKLVAAEGKAAVDIKLYGAFEAHMYIEVKDGNVSVEPFDYIERDLEAAVPVDVALAIANGKITVKEAVENGTLYVFGNVQFALKFAKLFK